MSKFLLSLDEIDRIRRLHQISSATGFEAKTSLNRKTWSRALTTRRPTPEVLNELAKLGARPNKILIAEQDTLAS